MRADISRWALVAALVACAGEPRSEEGRPAAAVEAAPSGRYVFYLHGRLTELQGDPAQHPEFGGYEYRQIVAALGADGATVVSEVRPDTDPTEYAATVAAEVEALLAAGVPERNIAVVGFSKGGWIAARTSVLLQRPGVRFVLLGTCNEQIDDWVGGALHGAVLAIYEASDEIAGSCRELFALSESGLEAEELRLDTGLRHGAFYQVRDPWLAPTLAWIEG